MKDLATKQLYILYSILYSKQNEWTYKENPRT
jgi:hypothetical protein